jgi:alpha-tubulin suppressor-like RCC1 family protein
MRRIGTIVVAGALALLCSGCTLYGWGDNFLGQLGDGTLITPRVDPVPAARNPNWIMVDAGRFHACGIDVDHALFCWGDDLGGEIGDGAANPSVPRTNPTRVGTASDWTDVSAGGFGGAFPLEEQLPPGHTCGIRAGGALYCWGNNANGQLGDGTLTNRSAPTRIGGASDWTRVSTGGFHTCGIRSGGALYCWGDNTQGQLGDGTNTSSTFPMRVGIATDWTLVSAGFSAHTCGIRSDGALYCWGDNTDGQLGDNTTTDRTIPTQVGTATDWMLVSAGGAGTYYIGFGFGVATGFTCGTRAGGALYCWGENGLGQLGDGTMTNRSTPTRIGGATDWKDISLGAVHSCGIRAGGALYCWGSNILGDGTTTDSTIPVQNELGGWVSVSAGRGHTEGLRL